jgi:pantoate--beta-alanine ligase
MQIIESLEELKQYSQGLKDQGKTLASIDSYGDFHQGHSALIEVAKARADNTIVTIDHMPEYQEYSTEKYADFLDKYKATTFLTDQEFCQSKGVDAISHMPDGTWNQEETFDFAPLYLRNIINSPNRCHAKTIQEWTHLMKEMQPTFDVAGEKDFYQIRVFQGIISALNLPIEVVGVPLVRDSDGLPFSSRNLELTKGERTRASTVYKTLKEVSEWDSYPSVEIIKNYVASRVSNARGKLHFADVCDTETGSTLSEVGQKTSLVVAANFGKTFLSDNVVLTK